MAQMTIAQMREKDVDKFVEMTGASEETARKIFNSFYRLAGLEYRVMEMENDGFYYERHSKYIEKQSERAYNWAERLRKQLEAYGLSLHVSGGYPKIVKTHSDTSISIVFYGHYYH